MTPRFHLLGFAAAALAGLLAIVLIGTWHSAELADDQVTAGEALDPMVERSAPAATPDAPEEGPEDIEALVAQSALSSGVPVSGAEARAPRPTVIFPAGPATAGPPQGGGGVIIIERPAAPAAPQTPGVPTPQARPAAPAAPTAPQAPTPGVAPDGAPGAAPGEMPGAAPDGRPGVTAPGQRPQATPTPGAAAQPTEQGAPTAAQQPQTAPQAPAEPGAPAGVPTDFDGAQPTAGLDTDQPVTVPGVTIGGVLLPPTAAAGSATPQPIVGGAFVPDPSQTPANQPGQPIVGGTFLDDADTEPNIVGSVPVNDGANDGLLANLPTGRTTQGQIVAGVAVGAGAPNGVIAGNPTGTDSELGPPTVLPGPNATPGSDLETTLVEAAVDSIARLRYLLDRGQLGPQHVQLEAGQLQSILRRLPIRTRAPLQALVNEQLQAARLPQGAQQLDQAAFQRTVNALRNRVNNVRGQLDTPGRVRPGAPRTVPPTPTATGVPIQQATIPLAPPGSGLAPSGPRPGNGTPALVPVTPGAPAGGNATSAPRIRTPTLVPPFPGGSR